MTQLTRPSRPLNVLISEPQGIVGEDQFEPSLSDYRCPLVRAGSL